MRRPPALTLDDVDLRRANPPRGVALPAPQGGMDLLRSRIEDDSYAFRQDRPDLVEGVKAALADGRAPTNVDVAAMAIAVLKASERIADDPVVDDVNETLLGWFESPELALRALARRTPLVFSAKAMTGYYEEDRCA